MVINQKPLFLTIALASNPLLLLSATIVLIKAISFFSPRCWGKTRTHAYHKWRFQWENNHIIYIYHYSIYLYMGMNGMMG